jgi:hypothetical protein
MLKPYYDISYHPDILTNFHSARTELVRRHYAIEPSQEGLKHRDAEYAQIESLCV